MMCIPIESADAISHDLIISPKPCKYQMKSSKEIYKKIGIVLCRRGQV